MSGRVGLTARFAVVAALIVLVLGLLLQRSLSNYAEDQALDDARSEVRDVIAPLIVSELQPGDFQGAPWSEDRVAAFDHYVQDHLRSPRILRVKVWDREGRVLYSDSADQIGKVFGPRPPRDAAIDGETTSNRVTGETVEDTGEAELGALLEVYTPILFAGSSESAGAFEVYQDYGYVSARIASMQRTISLTLGGGLGVLYLGLLGIVHGGSRTITRQRRELEAALQERTRIAAVMDTTTDLVGIADANGRQLYINAAGRRMLGIGLDEPIAERQIAEFHPAWAGAMVLEEAIPVAVSSGSWSGETAVLAPDGHEIPVSQVILANRDSAGALESLATVIRDISERKLAEQALRESEERYRALAQSASDAIVSADASGYILSWNDAAVRIFGYRPEEMHGRPISTLMPERYRVRAMAALAQLTEAGTGGPPRRPFELDGLRKDGTEFPLELSIGTWSVGGRRYLSGIVRDITDRKRTEAALQRSEQEFRLLFASNPAPMWVFDRVNLRFLEVNEAAARLYGYSREEFLQLQPWDVLQPDEAERFAGYLAQAPLPDGDTGEWRHRHKGGEEIWVHIYSHNVQLDGHLARLTLVQDITSRRRAEEALRRSEQEFRLLFAANPQPMFVFDVESLRFLQANDAALAQYGYSAEEFLALQATDIRPPGEVSRFRAYVESGADEIDAGEWLHRRKDGTNLWVHIRTHIVEFDGRRARLVSAENITARKEVEEAIARLAAIVESSQDAIVSRALDGSILTWNAAAERLYGYTAAEALGRTLEFVEPAEQVGEVRAIMARAMAGEHIQGLETRRVTKGGAFVEVAVTMFPVRDRDGEVLAIAGIHRDITASKAAERALAESERKFRELVQTVDAIVWEGEAEPFRVTFVSDQVVRMLGYQPDAWLSDPDFWYRHVHPEDRAESVRRFREAVATRRDYSAEWRVNSADGRELWFQDLVRVEDANGSGVRLHGIMFDITARKQAEVAIARLAALEERQRLARELHDSVSQALYGIGLGAYTALRQLESEPARATEAMEYVLSLAEAGLTEMRALIFELRPDSLQVEGLVAAIERQGAALSVRHGITVQSTQCDEPDVPIEVKEAIYRVVQESLQNSVKHSRAQRITLRLEQCPGSLHLRVQDDGIGFDATQPYPGHLGLRSMRERVERLNGTFSIESAPGQGVTIEVDIPVAPPA
jgi:PAS domain S-box-containing protein